MGRDDAVLLTGATGALGSWLVRAAIEDGASVCALARGAAGSSARQRVQESLAVTGVQQTPGLSVVEGDIFQDNCGITDGRLPGRVGLVVHCAACTDFHDTAAELNYRANVAGVKHVLEFARRHHAPVVHLSTAYVAGTQTGRVYEDNLDMGQGFNNVYERTKCHGEAMVRQWAAETGLPAIILRPSIVAGDWQGGRALRFNTLYDMMHAMDALAPAARGERLRVVAQTDATKNIIPVDYFADVAWRIIRRGRAGTFHIVHPRPTDVCPVAADLLGVVLR
ncbi:MAG: SDR family oxidoreductase [Tepidisphaerales bacterium]